VRSKRSRTEDLGRGVVGGDSLSFFSSIGGIHQDLGTLVVTVPPPPPPPFPGTIVIDGPTKVLANRFCSYEAIVTGGTPPYGMVWYKDGTFLGRGSTMIVATGVSDFTLRVDVTDADQTFGSDPLNCRSAG